MFRFVVLALFAVATQGFSPRVSARGGARTSALQMQGDGLKIDMRGKTVFVAGVADSTGYGWAIAKACAEAGAKIVLGTWPPVLPVFQMGIERGQFDEDQKLSDGSMMKIEKVRLSAIFPACPSSSVSLHNAHCLTHLTPPPPPPPQRTGLPPGRNF